MADSEHFAALAEERQERYRQVRNVTLVGAMVNVVLAIGKVAAGLMSHSQSLIADGVHSLSDLISDAVVVVAAKHTSRGADEDHPYGHGRIETVATVALGIFLIAVAVGIVIDASYRLFSPERLLVPGVLALAVAAISVVAKEIMYQYTAKVARRMRSNMLRANAWHHRTDAISSVVVIIGVLGTMAGLTYLDAIAAIAVSLMIAKAGWDLGWHSVRELVDTALSPERVDSIRQSILAVDGVRAMHLLRTRTMGGNAFVDVHILVDPRLSVSEGHQISEAVRKKLLRDIEEVGDVTVHIDPEDDELSKPCDHLPLRDQVLSRLQKHWRNTRGGDMIQQITLHYLDGKIHVDVLLPLRAFASLDEARAVAQELSAAGAGDEDIADIRIAFA